SDPAFVNLTTVEQFLQERRPFFVEGASIFDFGGTGPYIQFGNTPQYFYSRRIGRAPSLEPEAPAGGFIDLPTHTTILGAAQLTGDTAALRLTEEQPTRYYQRPDAGYLSRRYDPRRTSLSGIGADFSINKEGGNSNWGFALSTTTPGFEVNDLGFQRRTDRTAGDLFVGHRWTTPGRVFRQASIGVDPLAFAWNYGGDRIQFARDINVFGQLLNY